MLPGNDLSNGISMIHGYRNADSFLNGIAIHLNGMRNPRLKVRCVTKIRLIHAERTGPAMVSRYHNWHVERPGGLRKSISERKSHARD